MTTVPAGFTRFEGPRRSVMNAEVEVIRRNRSEARTSEFGEDVDLNPSRGILLAVALSILGWVLVLAAIIAV